MKLSKKNLTGLAVAASLGLGAGGSAEAAALAQSYLLFSGVTFSNNATGVQLDASGFDRLQIQDNTTLNPSVNNSVFNPGSQTTAGGAPIPNFTRCVIGTAPGACGGLTPAPFTAMTPAPFPPAGGDGALAAANLAGNPITGLPVSGAGGTTAQLEARAQVTGPANTAATGSNLGLLAQFSFSLANNTDVRFDLDSISHLIAFLDSGGSANAGESWSLNIVDQTTGGNVVFSWSPDGVVGTGISGTLAGFGETTDDCNLQGSRGVLSPGTATFDCSGHHRANTGLLLASDIYTISIAHQNRADVSRQQNAPEPASLALVGLGLLGLAGFVRRKTQR
jgi:PEP-CTERM motif